MRSITSHDFDSMQKSHWHPLQSQSCLRQVLQKWSTYLARSGLLRSRGCGGGCSDSGLSCCLRGALKGWDASGSSRWATLSDGLVSGLWLSLAGASPCAGGRMLPSPGVKGSGMRIGGGGGRGGRYNAAWGMRCFIFSNSCSGIPSAAAARITSLVAVPTCPTCSIPLGLVFSGLCWEAAALLGSGLIVSVIHEHKLLHGATTTEQLQEQQLQ